MVWLTDARTPDGMRLYAVGDVHGCTRELDGMLAAIDADLAARPVGDWRIILLGDYVDRGPDSRGVIEMLVARAAADPRALFLRGNHDEMFEGAIAGDRKLGEIWLNNGGVETLESYGLGLVDAIDALRQGRPMTDSFPESHRLFLGGLVQSLQFGDYYFVHAGIDPLRPLDDQDDSARLWIRDRFLTSDRQYEAVIVHGHTPVEQVEVRPNRIGIDTGAVFGGALSCLVLEGGHKALLGASGLTALTGTRGGAAAEREPGVLGRMLRLPRFGRRG